MDDSKFLNASYFHSSVKKIYSGELDGIVNKKSDKMAKVVYEPAHLNPDFLDDDARRGKGKDFATWVFSEEPDTAEGLFSNGLELFMDAYFEPDASVGLHRHSTTDEIYYIISGSIRMTTITGMGKEVCVELTEGDAHAVYAGESHFGTAGAKGCRAIVVALKNRG